MCLLVWHTICDSLVKIHQLFIRENTEKTQQNQEHSITCSYSKQVDIPKCLDLLDTQSIKVCKNAALHTGFKLDLSM